MDVTDLSPLLGQLEDNIEDLETALEPLLRKSLSEVSAKLPLLDKAKLYVLVTYAIESILFSYLRLKGVNAKEHPVFRELTRVKQYFEKIKSAESSSESKRENLSLDKQAAGRIIKHALAANDVQDRKRAEVQAGERARAHQKAEVLAQKQKKVTKEELNSSSSSGSESSPSESSTSSSDDDSSEDEPQPKRPKHESNTGAAREDVRSKGVSSQPAEPINNVPVTRPENTAGRKRKRKGRGKRGRAGQIKE